MFILYRSHHFDGDHGASIRLMEQEARHCFTFYVHVLLHWYLDIQGGGGALDECSHITLYDPAQLVVIATEKKLQDECNLKVLICDKLN